MKITEVRVFPKDGSDSKLRAFVNITFDDCFVVRGLKVIEGQKGLFVVMPSRKLNETEHRDVAHPVTAEFRDYIEKEVLDAFEDQEYETYDQDSDLTARAAAEGNVG